jgi:hypothetical protein
MRLHLGYFAVSAVLLFGFAGCGTSEPSEGQMTLAGMFNNLPGGVFYKDKDSGKWMMRPPF